MRSLRRAGIIAAVCGVIVLTGCTHSGDLSGGSKPSQTAWTAQPDQTGSPAAGYRAGGTAQQNRAVFTATVTATVKAHPDASGRTMVEALTHAGFDQKAMQVTASKTSADLVPGSISVSVKIGAQCLIGQWGSAVDGAHTQLAHALGSGGCLVGGTVPTG